MTRRLLTGALALLLALLLSGCGAFFSQNVNDLLRAPKLGQGYSEVQQALADYLDVPEPQYKYPKEGDWLSPILFADLDGNGKNEAVLLYSVADDVNAAREKGANVYLAVLEQSEGVWEVTHDEPGLAAEVASLDVSDLLGNGTKQLIVGYATSNFSQKTLGIYTYKNLVLTRQFEMDYSRYEIGDFTGSGRQEMVVVSRDNRPNGVSLRYIPTVDGQFITDTPPEEVELDLNFNSCAAIVPSLAPGAGSNGGDGLLLVVDGVTETGALASELVYYNGERFYTPADVVNPLRASTGRLNTLLISRDIDGDGVVEIPKRVGGSIQTINADKNLEYVDWIDYITDEENPQSKQYGMVDSNRGVYIRFPDSWKGAVSVVDGDARGEWKVQNRKTLATLLSLHILDPGDVVPVGYLPVPGTTSVFLQVHSGLPEPERSVITMTSLI